MNRLTAKISQASAPAASSSARPGWLAAALLSAAVALVGCEALPGSTQTAAGSPAQPGSQLSSSAVAGDAARNVAVGQSSVRALATFEGDMACSKLVAPFQLADNLDDLTKLGTEIATLVAKGAATNALGQFIDGNRGRARLALEGGRQELRHVVPQELRARAVRLNWLPMAAERKYGEMALERMKAELLTRDSELGRRLYPQADALLAQMLTGVDEKHDYQFSIHLATGSAGAALALPGGLIVLDAPLLMRPQLQLKAQYAMAHEIAHVLQRHETRALQARIIDTLMVSGKVVDLYQNVRSLRGDPGPVLQTLFAGKLQFQRHFGDQEMHADACAIRILDRAMNDRPRMHGVVNAFVVDLSAAAAKQSAAMTAAPAGATVALATPATPPWSAIGSALAGAAGSALAAGGAAPGGAGAGGATAAAPSPLDDLVTMVSSPLDRHPDPQRRVKHIQERMVTFPMPAPAVTRPAAGSGRPGAAPRAGPPAARGPGAAGSPSVTPPSTPPARPPARPPQRPKAAPVATAPAAPATPGR